MPRPTLSNIRLNANSTSRRHALMLRWCTQKGGGDRKRIRLLTTSKMTSEVHVISPHSFFAHIITHDQGVRPKAFIIGKTTPTYEPPSASGRPTLRQVLPGHRKHATNPTIKTQHPHGHIQQGHCTTQPTPQLASFPVSHFSHNHTHFTSSPPSSRPCCQQIPTVTDTAPPLPTTLSHL